MGLFDKVTDPLGLKKKAKKKLGITKLEKKIGLDDIREFEKFNFKRMWDMLREDPERILIGSFDPLSTKMWNKIRGTKHAPIINQMGGATQQAFADAEAAGIDTGPARTAHQVAEAIASWYGGGALGKLAGQGATALGAGRAASYAPRAGRAVVSMAPGMDPVPTYSGKDASGYDWSVDPAGLRGYKGLGFAEGGSVMTYKKGGRTEFKRGKELTEDIAEIAQVPGGLEMLVTMAAEEYGGDTGRGKQVRLFRYADGGAVEAAERTRRAGRGDDEMLVHMSPEEYEAIEAMWGPADMNPRTGIPEYGFLSKLWKGIKKTVKKIVKSPLFSFVAPIALNVFAPGLGSAVGNWLGATGKAAATIGNTVVRAGLGAVSGGKEGAISGALSGLTSSGVGADIGKKIGLEGMAGKVAGDALLGGIAGEGTGVGFAQGATGQAMQSLAGNPMQKLESAITAKGREMFDPITTVGMDPDIGGMSIVENPQQDPFGLEGITGAPPSGPMSPVPPGSGATGLTVFGDPQGPGFLDRAGDWMREHPWLTAGGALLAGSALSGSGRGDEGPPGRIDTGTNFYDDLPNLSFDRQAMPVEDYYSYGRASGPGGGGEQLFFSGNQIPSTTPPAATPPGPGGRGGRGRGGRRGLLERTIEMAHQPGMGGQQPFKVKGPYDLIKVSALVNDQGWTYDENTKTAYPPGTFGVGGTGPVTGAYHGGEVMAYRLGGLVQKYAEGGSARHVKGPGTGRSDDIPAVLSDGEYVIDSETVALLGDGSTDAGARRLDEMREKLRKHKGGKLSEGKFSDAAKTPEEYMAEGGKATKKGGGSALKDLKKLAQKLDKAISSGNKKRVKEISAQLKSLDGGEDVVKGLARGGSVKRIIDDLERVVESDYRGPVEGKVERRLRDRRQKERKESEGRRRTKLTKKEKVELAEELGGFTKNSKFIRNLRRQLDTQKEAN